MTIPAYPAGLPLPLRSGYEFEPVEQIRRTPMDSGRARQRVEFGKVPTMVTLKWIFNDIQARLFQAWAMQAVGAGWFTIRLVTPLGFDTLEVRFTKTPIGPELMGRYSWGFSAVCEVKETPLLEPGWAELLPDYVLRSDIFDYAMNREWPLNPWQTFIETMDTTINEDWPQP